MSEVSKIIFSLATMSRYLLDQEPVFKGHWWRFQSMYGWNSYSKGKKTIFEILDMLHKCDMQMDKVIILRNTVYWSIYSPQIVINIAKNIVDSLSNKWWSCRKNKTQTPYFQVKHEKWKSQTLSKYDKILYLWSQTGSI